MLQCYETFVFTSLVPQAGNCIFLCIIAGFVAKKPKLIYMVSSNENVMRTFDDIVIII